MVSVSGSNKNTAGRDYSNSTAIQGVEITFCCTNSGVSVGPMKGAVTNGNLLQCRVG